MTFGNTQLFLCDSTGKTDSMAFDKIINMFQVSNVSSLVADARTGNMLLSACFEKTHQRRCFAKHPDTARMPLMATSMFLPLWELFAALLLLHPSVPASSFAPLLVGP